MSANCNVSCTKLHIQTTMTHQWLYSVMCLLSCDVRALCSGVRIPVDLWMYVGLFQRYWTVQCAVLRRLNPQPMETRRLPAGCQNQRTWRQL